MYGYDPILLEKRNINEWLNESADNILLIFDKSQLNFSKSPLNTSNDKIFCLKRQFIFNPQLKELCVECILNNNKLMVKETYNSENMYYNIGYYINKNVLIDVKNITPTLENERIFKIDIIKNESKYISKELLSLSQIGLFKYEKDENISIEQKTVNTILDKLNIPYEEDVYFEEILAKALYDYSYEWDGAINSYLRIGKKYFKSDIFKHYYKRYGTTIEESSLAIKAKIEDLDRVFLEASSKSESLDTIYFRGMRQPFDNLYNIGDKIVIPNFISITTNYDAALRFTSEDCCIYKLILSKGVPYINMINTTKFKFESEILLPRDLVYEIINIEKLKITKKNKKREIVTLNVRLREKDQFKINKNCRDFYLGNLIHYNPSYLKNIDKISSKDNKETPKKISSKDNKETPKKISSKDNKETPKKISSKDNKETPKKISKRSPIGTRKNKTEKQQTIENNIEKNKLPRCKKGTRRNKVTGNCEPI